MILEFDKINWEDRITGEIRYSITFAKSRPKDHKLTVDALLNEIEEVGGTYNAISLKHVNEIPEYVKSLFSKEILSLLKKEFPSKNKADEALKKVKGMYQLRLDNMKIKRKGGKNGLGIKISHTNTHTRE
ncbi:hypothetical protein [Xanthovirga aplysinae]|uniref:hypothetical protein n=1 Tax=Xanthovirga aplysinae TaxID=2529853 RepID=UPI0012BD748B|nr:hypothetical protein [Xanthovirga aplysinae]MTI33293.1 hypothetical protein [Xanthovirga aplysinae]